MTRPASRDQPRQLESILPLAISAERGAAHIIRPRKKSRQATVWHA